MKYFYIVLILFFSFTIFSCSKESDSSTTSTTTELEGTWKSPCYSRSGGYYLTVTNTVSGTSLVQDYDYHSDSSCSSDNYSIKYTYGSYSEGEDMVFSSYGSSGGYGKRFTMTLSTVTETPQNSSEVSWYNSNTFCGDSDWALNTAHDTTGKTCGGSTRWSANTTIYGLYLLDGNSLFIEDSNSSYPTSVGTGDNDTLTKQ